MSIEMNAMPKLGFGLMRLPEKDGAIDSDHVCRMVDRYMKAGMNYFDTAYIYHGGKSETAAREALVRRYPDDWRSKNFYSGLIQRSGKASDCIGCGQCEKVCPQHLKIIELMKEASGILDMT